MSNRFRIVSSRRKMSRKSFVMRDENHNIEMLLGGDKNLSMAFHYKINRSLQAFDGVAYSETETQYPVDGIISIPASMFFDSLQACRDADIPLTIEFDIDKPTIQ